MSGYSILPVHRLFAACGAAILLLSGSTMAGADQPPIKIGLIYSYGGEMTTYGRIVDSAITAYENTYGDTIAGRKIEIVKRDDGGISPENAKRIATELIVQDNVDVLAGNEYTPNAIAVGAVSTQSKKPFLDLNAATSKIMVPNPYMSRYGFTTAQITVPLAQWAARNGIKRAYILYTDYGPGIDASTAFTSAFTGAGGQIVASVGVPVANLDFSAYVERLREAAPQAVYLFLGSGNQPPAFLKAFYSAGLGKKIKILASGDLVDENLLPALGSDADGIVSSFNYSNSHPSKANADFLRAFKKVDPTDVADFHAVAAWDIMHAIASAVNAQHGDTNPDKFMAAVKGMRWESPRGPVEVDPNTRDLVQNVYIRRTELRGGKYVNTEIDTIPAVSDPNEK